MAAADAAAPTPASRRSTRWRVRGRPRVGAAAVVLLLLALVVVGRTFVLSPVRIASGSMSPTLLRGDVVLVDRRQLDVHEVRRGDLVTFGHPQTGEESLKRVVGVPGDTVVVLDSVLHVNGEPVDEPYVDFSEWEGMFTARVTVPPRAFYVLGDERGISVDSRDFGVVPAERLDGRVLLRLWPPVRVGDEEPQPPRPWTSGCAATSRGAGRSRPPRPSCRAPATVATSPVTAPT